MGIIISGGQTFVEQPNGRIYDVCASNATCSSFKASGIDVNATMAEAKAAVQAEFAEADALANEDGHSRQLAHLTGGRRGWVCGFRYVTHAYSSRPMPFHPLCRRYRNLFYCARGRVGRRFYQTLWARMAYRTNTCVFCNGAMFITHRFVG